MDKKNRNTIIFNRVDDVRKELGLSQTDFAIKTGINPVIYSQLKSGATGLSGELLYGIANGFPWVNLHWILAGEGEMFTDNHYRNVVNEGVAEYLTSNKELADIIRQINDLPEAKQQAIIMLLKGQLALLK